MTAALRVEPPSQGIGVYGPEYGMRPGTSVRRWAINFIFNEGGMGDFINYSAATVFVAKTAPWVEARVWVPRYLQPLMADIHAEFKHVKVMASEDFEKLVEDGTNLVGPDIRINGMPQTKQLLTCLGAHQIDVGFAYYAAMAPTPPEIRLPILDYPASKLHPKVKRLRGQYAVIPCGYSAEARKTTGVHINPIIDYLKEKGITPVFLGKRNLLGDEKVTTNFVEDYNYEAGLDLRGETSVKDAACIMQHAKFTIGLDCGLLHLAALMKDSKIIFGYNITTIENRVPRRDHGKTINVTLTKQELPCIGCQTNWRNFPQHRFDKCFYEQEDRKAAAAYGKKYESALCVTLLYRNQAERFKRAIDEVLA